MKALAPTHPEWKDQEPFASLLKGDLKDALAGGEKAMLELLAYLRANGFKTFIVSGGGIEFMRPWRESRLFLRNTGSPIKAFGKE